MQNARTGVDDADDDAADDSSPILIYSLYTMYTWEIYEILD